MFLISRLLKRERKGGRYKKPASAVVTRQKVHEEIKSGHVKERKGEGRGLRSLLSFTKIFKLFLPKELPDLNLLSLTILMLVGGLLMIFSASAVIAYTKYGDTFFFFKRQIIWIIIGGFAGYTLYILPLKAIRKLSPLILMFSIFLLLYILPEAIFGYTDSEGVTSGIQMPFVQALNGATRWINIGGFSLQPTELVKFSLVLYFSAWLTRDFKISSKDVLGDHFRKVLIPFTGLAGIVSLLILAQRDFDSTVVIFLTVLMVYYMSGSDRIHTLGSLMILGFSGLFGTIAMVLEPYRRSRIASFFDIFIHGSPSGDKALADSFQVWNGLVALGSGGIFGLGYGESRQKLGFLQDAAFTDSIFVIIGEEFGFIGVLLVIIAFLYFASLGLKIARNSEDKFASLLAVGMTGWITIQAFFNIAANLSVIPFGGMALPFFTYGGSSTIVTLMSIGVILNVSRNSKVQTVRRRVEDE